MNEIVKLVVLLAIAGVGAMALGHFMAYPYVSEIRKGHKTERQQDLFEKAVYDVSSWLRGD